MVFQDGGSSCREDSGSRAHIVFDELIAAGEMPPTVGLFINPGVVPASGENAQPRFNRSFEYDSAGDRYARFLIEEMIPRLSSEHGLNVSDNPDDRGICGASSGAVAAFTAAWERPDAFRRVYSMIGTFVNLRGAGDYGALIRKTEPKPLRIFLQDGSNDLNIYAGDWWMENQTIQRALEWAGYEVKHEWGDGGHSREHGARIFADAMRWLWKDHGKTPVSTHIDKSGDRSPITKYLHATDDWEVVSTGHDWAEGMAAADDGTFYFTDVPASKLYKIAPDGTQTLISSDTGRANGIALGRDGKTLYTASSGAKEIRAYNLETGAYEMVTSGTGSNDIVVSHSGHLYYTDPRASTIWHVDLKTKKRTAVDAKFKSPNGIGMSADQTQLFVCHFLARHVFSYTINEDGSLKNKQPYFHARIPVNQPEGRLDGMTSTSTGELLVGTGCGIQIFDQPGRVQLVLPRPRHGDGRTNYVCFGGENRKTLYVATRHTIYKRPTKLTGAPAWKAPVKPPKPRL